MSTAASAWLPTAPCTPERCATRPGLRAAAAPRTAARLLAGLLTVLAGVLLTPLAPLAGAAVRARLTRLWCRAVVRAFGVRVRVAGATLAPGASLVVANHISWLDIPLVASVLPGRMLAKREVRRWPLLGALAARGGTVFLDRDRLRALPGTVREVADALRGGSRVVVFPEGSTWCGREQGRFRPAAFQAALDAGVPVQPVRLGYAPTGPAAFVGDDPLLVSLWRIAAARGLTAEVRILPPVPAGRHTDRRALALEAQTAIARSVDGRSVTAAALDARSARGRSVNGRNGAAAPVRATAAPVRPPAQTAVASDSANRPAASVHQCVNSSPAVTSSVRTPS
ncbi:lysophospholipid acyltransferase family protein [Streptomyces sp. NPDC001941]|uniref:lysophospholipid acyltransferase family protein n=1 Tax=Streptomyces sp. NPDC001941 TaxID=3154659 RepID=UPI00331E1A77